ncbi:MAG: VOC family protein [Actinomycetota bacterium]|nr:VOC family protein [Actinomycetota bacterium]
MTHTSAVATGTDLLPADTSMDAVTLHVDDLPRMTAYYRDAIALSVLRESGHGVVLGRGATPLLVLRHTPGLPVPGCGQAGLFHTAILFADRAALAAAVASAARVAPSSYVGAADHLVSLAFYFTDPEGNGVELYTDRPREEWRWLDGGLQMASLPLDARAYLSKHLTDDRAPDDGAVVGHVHLQVGDTATAHEFYVRALGFEETTGWHGSALFVSAGGYHHHMAMNTWNSVGAGPRAATLGLGEVSIVVPTREEVAALVDRLRHRRVAVADDGAAITFADPWKNLIRVTASR